MTSYLRYIFGGGSPSPSHDKSHSRSRSNPANFIYGPPAGSGPASSSRLKTKRSNSFCAPSPSPLRYTSYDGDMRYGTPSKAEKVPLYRRSSYRESEHVGHYPLYTPHAPPVSFGTSSRTSSSSSSLLPSMVHPGTPSHVRRPSLQQRHTWQSSISSATGSVHSYGMDPHGRHASPLHMHPLFASTRLHSAPINYDVTFAPSPRTVLDRATHSAVDVHTLSQPATDPPTPASSRILLRSDKFPSSKSGRSQNITNLDLLHALYETLLTRVTPQEWEGLGNGSRAQRKVTQAYEKRCTKLGGGWEGGVRRVDWLHGKTRLIGIEVEKHGHGVGSGRLVFGKT
ncbi:uncharacterized protein EDB91DRAFT_1235736 [Suillus paluster]|uniref:uncharacterized protein n=1 Tax=Suillus paluster TaxID=48578 RepID=UPI001B867D7A|nr:uncharacterized protein EDB91DRAFT_1235736 [Suillus paluster]KAG1748458.1 hypothetical protein EDB91DRAFT_1235736 [Suillus paluster]